MHGCPGRFLFRTGISASDIAGLLGQPALAHEFRSAIAPDPVLVCRFEDGGGILSYRKPDGTFLHTLNTREGLERKLAQLGISIEGV
jgi:hypothetical protein